MNLFSDNADLQYHFREGIAWERFVPLWEEGFRFEDGPRSLAEARELYEESLREVGGVRGARDRAARARDRRPGRRLRGRPGGPSPRACCATSRA